MSKKRSQWPIVLGFCMALTVTGCGTIASRIVGPHWEEYRDPPLPRIYSGAILDFRGFWHPDHPGTNNVELFCLVDLPLSLVADTIILPLTIYEQNKYGDYGASRVTKE